MDRAVFTDAERYRQAWGRGFAPIRACLDACPHRGALVCRAVLRSIRRRVRTHRGWSHDLADALVSGSQRADRPESFGTTEWHPVEVLCVASPRRSVFGTRNPESVPLREPLGDAARYRDATFGHDDQGAVVVGWAHAWTGEDNGKPAPCGLGQSPRVRSRSSAAASCLGGVAGRSPS